MGKDPAMPFYVNDWLSSGNVTCMSLEQQGAFLRLLCHCWASQDASLPDDDDQLAALSGMGQGWLQGGCTLVRKCLVPHPDKPGHLTNERTRQLWIERQEWRQKSSEGGLKSAAAKKKRQPNGGSTTVSTKAQPNGNSPSSSPSSYLPPPTPAAAPGGASRQPAADPAWKAVVAELLAVEVGEARSAVITAQANLCTPAIVLRVIDHWKFKRPAWGPGALFNRILALRPDQDHVALWPPPSKAAELSEASSERRRLAAQDAAKRNEAEARRQAAIAEDERLEREHGAAVDALERRQAIAILDAVLPKGWGKVTRPPPSGGKFTGSLRLALLRHFEDIAAPALG